MLKDDKVLSGLSVGEEDRSDEEFKLRASCLGFVWAANVVA